MVEPKIIFMGTPEFAVPALEEIHSKYKVSAVVTIPVKIKGRGLKMIPSAVKIKADELNIPVLQPEDLKNQDFLEKINEINPDIIVVIAFRILPKILYSKAKIASFNIHGSLLPKYRGAAPINHAIINGETESGLTSFILQDKVDTGNILLQKTLKLNSEMTSGELHDLLMPLAAELSIETIELLLNGNYSPLIQDENIACPAPKLTKENTKINWAQTSQQIINFIRGLTPYPSAWTKMNDSTLKIHKAIKCNSNILKAGEFRIGNKQFLVGTIDSDILIQVLQPENKKSMPLIDFLNGYRGITEGLLN
jgi:methionyl-tRNA formyltransferase